MFIFTLFFRWQLVYIVVWNVFLNSWIHVLNIAPALSSYFSLRAIFDFRQYAWQLLFQFEVNWIYKFRPLLRLAKACLRHRSHNLFISLVAKRVLVRSHCFLSKWRQSVRDLNRGAFRIAIIGNRRAAMEVTTRSGSMVDWPIFCSSHPRKKETFQKFLRLFSIVVFPIFELHTCLKAPSGKC